MNTAVLIISYFIMLVGVLGCILPFLPGTPLVFLGIFIYAWKTQFQIMSPNFLIILLIVTVITVLLDYIAGSIGSKKFGASKFGVTGAFLGAMAGVFFTPWGIIIGPPLGALTGELIGGKDIRDASMASFGAVIGILGGSFTKIIASLIMIGFFTVKVF